MNNKKHKMLIMKLFINTLMTFTIVINMLITKYSRFVKIGTSDFNKRSFQQRLGITSVNFIWE